MDERNILFLESEVPKEKASIDILELTLYIHLINNLQLPISQCNQLFIVLFLRIKYLGSKIHNNIASKMLNICICALKK